MLRLFSKLDYVFRETFLGLKRGGWMNWAAISTVAVLLFLFGASLQATWQVENVVNQMGSQLELSVYLSSNADSATMQPRLFLVNGVADVKLITKDEAWEKLLKDLGKIELGTATEQLGENPLVDEFKVRAISSDRLPNIAERISGLSGVDEVWYTSEVVDRLGQLRKAMGSASVAIVVIFTTIAIAVITTTIRLIVLARRREIEVMQLVGVTALWIYFPFVLQGVVFGIAGAGLAYLMLTGCLHILSEVIINQPELIKSLTTGLLTDLRVQFLLPAILLVFGSTIGVLGSLIAVRRFSLN